MSNLKKEILVFLFVFFLILGNYIQHYLRRIYNTWRNETPCSIYNPAHLIVHLALAHVLTVTTRSRQKLFRSRLDRSRLVYRSTNHSFWTRSSISTHPQKKRRHNTIEWKMPLFRCKFSQKAAVSSPVCGAVLFYYVWSPGSGSFWWLPNKHRNGDIGFRIPFFPSSSSVPRFPRIPVIGRT